MNLVLWVVQGLLALSCVFSGLSKAFRPLAKVHQQFPWANHVPAALVRFIGVSELLGGIGLVLPSALGIFPWLTVAAAAGLALLMLCAALFHASRREFPSIGANAVLLGLSALLVVGRLVWM
jgi:putative oxidoreductase